MKSFIYLLAAVPLAAAPLYTVTSLGGVGGSRSDAFAINAFGVAAGAAIDADGRSHGFSYENFVADFGEETDARGINSQGQVVGSQGGYATVWKSGTPEIIVAGSGLAINDRGYVTGAALGSNGQQQAFLAANGKLINLGTLGGVSSAGYGINENGQIVGSAQTGRGDGHAFVWDQATGMRDLGTLGGWESRAMAINAAGTVVGAAATRSRYFHATLWDPSGLAMDLGTLGGGHSYAYALNDAGHAVGWSFDSLGRTRAFVWTGGMLVDLNDLISDQPGWSLTAAYGINTAGQIVGTGTYLGETVAFRLDPVIHQREFIGVAQSDLPLEVLGPSEVPEPGSLMLVAGGVLLLSFRKQLRLTKRS